ncbi:WxL domain-containing protein [Bacillus thuringiensis]|nr:WxL domain-containing protein [Bacillus thuringiensis]
MNKKLLLAGVLITTTLFSASIPTLAAENTSDWEKVVGTEDGKGATSGAHVKLNPGDHPTKPIEPSEPDGETGNKGPLTIDNVTPLEFGEHELSGGKVEYEATSKSPNIQVSDNRGSGQGWTLKVTSASFQNTNDNTKTLRGAVVSLPEGTMKTTAGNVSEMPTPKAVVLDTDTATTQTIMTAEQNKGMGTWADVFDGSQVKISVPGGNYAGEYVSTLTWTLEDAPQA